MTNRDKATELFKEHWIRKTGRPADEAILDHMSYCIDAIEEALITKQREIDELKDVLKKSEANYVGKNSKLQQEILDLKTEKAEFVKKVEEITDRIKVMSDVAGNIIEQVRSKSDPTLGLGYSNEQREKMK